MAKKMFLLLGFFCATSVAVFSDLEFFQKTDDMGRIVTVIQEGGSVSISFISAA